MARAGGVRSVANKPRRRAGRDRCVLWVRTGRVGRVGTAGVDRVGALDLVAQIAYVRGGSAGRESGDVGSAREGHGGRGDEEVAKDLRGGAEVAAARRDNRGGAWHGDAASTRSRCPVRQDGRRSHGLGGRMLAISHVCVHGRGASVRVCAGACVVCVRSVFC